MVFCCSYSGLLDEFVLVKVVGIVFGVVRFEVWKNCIGFYNLGVYCFVNSLF